LPGIPGTPASETVGALLLAGALDAELLAGAAAWLDGGGLDAGGLELLEPLLEQAASTRPIAATPTALAMRYLI
jgi:hypothetical protein